MEGEEEIAFQLRSNHHEKHKAHSFSYLGRTHNWSERVNHIKTREGDFLPVVKEKLFTSLYRSLGKYANSMIPIYHHYCEKRIKPLKQDNANCSMRLRIKCGQLAFCIAIGVNRMICKSDLVAFPGCVNNKIWGEKETHKHKGHISTRDIKWWSIELEQDAVVTIVQIEQEAAHVLVIDFASAISLVLGDDLYRHRTRYCAIPQQHTHYWCVGLPITRGPIGSGQLTRKCCGFGWVRPKKAINNLEPCAQLH